MKKVLAIAVLLVGSLIQLTVAAERWHDYKHPLPRLQVRDRRGLRQHFPWELKALPPVQVPVGGAKEPKFLKCFRDVHIEKACTRQIIISYFTHKVGHLKPECCRSIGDISKDCVGPVFAYFKNPFFGRFLKAYSSKHAARPSHH